MFVEDDWSKRNEYGPKGIRLLTAQYYRKQKELEKLRDRIMYTNSGMAWLMRVERIGKKR
jgi:hypothetical protein